MDEITKKINQARAYLEEKAGAIKRPSGTYLRAQEKRLERKCKRRFNKQMNWVVENAKNISYFKEKENAKGLLVISRKDFSDEIKRFLEGLPENDELANDIGDTASDTYHRGARDVHKKLKMAEAGISFDLVNEDAVNYINKLKTIHLSDYRGSIKRETKKRILKILQDAISEGQAYSDVARQIQAQGDAGVFSSARAEMIAVNQVGRAYGEGNHTMVEKYHQETGAVVQKSWFTVNDDKVTPECMANQDRGWLGLDEHWPSGDSTAPRESNPRCRCVTGYRRVNLKGEEE